MSNRSKQKGDRAERQIVKELQDLGLKAARVPLSGAVGGEYSADIDLSIPGIGDVKAEVKSRHSAARGGSTIKKGVGENSLLLLKENNQEPLVVMSIRLFRDLITVVREADDYEEPSASPDDYREEFWHGSTIIGCP